jgi:hypothetical protein
MTKRRSMLGVGDIIYLPDIPGSKFADLPQYAVAVPASKSYAICVPYFEARSAPVHNDKVYVRRTRAADGKYEETLRTVKIKDKRVRLECQEPGGSKGYEGKVVTFPSSRRTETVEIRGLVIGWYEPTDISRGQQ